MRQFKNALVVALVVLTMSLAVLAQTPRKTNDPRNTAPTIGSGGSVGGASGLFTVVDGQTLRAGEYTFSVAYSNYDRDPGDVDITEVPLSFQVGLNNYIELFFNTDAYRAIKVNSPRNLSGFYLPNSQVNINGVFTSAPAIVLAPQGSGTPLLRGAIFRPQGTQPFLQYPYTGGSLGNFGLGGTIAGTIFGFPAGLPTAGPVRAGGGNGADLFPGIGSPVGGILPGLVLQTTNLTNAAGAITGTAPTSSTLAPSYLPDAPFLNRRFGESAFNRFEVGAKFRFTGPDNPIGIGLMPFYRFYNDKADDLSGFNQLQRGASPGGNRGDFGLIAFGDARVAKFVNISANVGYIYNSDVRAQFANGEFTLLDRGDEFTAGLAADFPVNQYFQPIGEIRATKYVGGRTPNAFENDPVDVLLGVRIFPKRYFGFSVGYRYHANQQDLDSFDGNGRTTVNNGGSTVTTNINGAPPGFRTSDDPHGFFGQFFIGRRNARQEPTKVNTPAVINSVNLSDTEIVTANCPEGQRQRAGSSCNDSTAVSVTTNATDADGDQLLYQYTVSTGTIEGSGANVTWNLGNAEPGTYTIAIGVDDGCGSCGQPTTREVRVVNCTDCEPIPDDTKVMCFDGLTVSVSSSLVDQGATVRFTADGNANGTNPGYEWMVSDGEIVSGQGSSSIEVRAPNRPGANFSATVRLTGLDPSCPTTASAPAQTNDDVKKSELIDDYGKQSNDKVKGRNDNAAIRLQEFGDDARIFVISYGSPAQVSRRNAFIAKDLATRKGIDPSRIVTVNGGTAPTLRTQVYAVPAGADDPTPEQ